MGSDDDVRACHVARPCPSFVTDSQFLGSCLAVRGKRRGKCVTGTPAGCYSHLRHAHAACRLLARAPREPRDRTSHRQTRRAGQPMGLIKSNTARRSWRLARLDWLVSMPIGPGDLAPSAPIRRARVRRPCFESFDSYSSDIHFAHPPT
jgi:hypothetical protein